MQVFVLRNPTSRVKGLLRRVGVEVSTNVFITTLTREEAHAVYRQAQEVATGNTACVFVEPATVEPGFSLKGFGDIQHTTEMIDGIPLRVRRRRGSRSGGL